VKASRVLRTKKPKNLQCLVHVGSAHYRPVYDAAHPEGRENGERPKVGGAATGWRAPLRVEDDDLRSP